MNYFYVKKPLKWWCKHSDFVSSIYFVNSDFKKMLVETGRKQVFSTSLRSCIFISTENFLVCSDVQLTVYKQ